MKVDLKSLYRKSAYRLQMAYELFIVFITFSYTILLISEAMDTLENHSWFTEERLIWIDRMLLTWFWLEYLIRLCFNKDKFAFIRRNWIDILAMIPLESYFRALRLLRVVRLLRLVRMSSFLWGFLRARQIQVSFGIALLIILWGAGGVYLLELQRNEGIDSFSDAIWWAVVTTTTVGYGDISPVTFGGRMIAIVLMFTGIGLIGSVTASVAAHFTQVLHHEKEGTCDEDRIRRQLVETAMGQLERIDELSPAEYDSLLHLLHHLRERQPPSEAFPVTTTPPHRNHGIGE
ncbi:potassium channel family protein [Salinithrix halophila]|uniref:Potassium channel family protein n=1 Tax=Salinithrix halophila TaxID=1485204 RepID=A0ABV8JF24_9BACL